MDKKLFDMVDKLSLDDLRTLSLYISSKRNSWNYQIKIEDVCLDFELKQKLLSIGINNIEQLKSNGTIGLPESMWEKAEWVIKTFDFDRLEAKYYNKRYKYNHK